MSSKHTGARARAISKYIGQVALVRLGYVGFGGFEVWGFGGLGVWGFGGYAVYLE